MWEWSYAKEPFDLKLMLLRLVSRVWILLLSVMIGIILWGGGYYLHKVIFAGPIQYEITGSYYIEYGTDPLTNNPYTYINAASWNRWVVTDWFVDRVWENAIDMGMEPLQYQIEKENLTSFLTADLPTDLKVATATVRTPDRELTILLEKALKETFQAFAMEQKEIESIRPVDTTEVKLAARGERLLQACILGGILGGFFSLTALILWLIWEDSESIYIPETFTFRYGIPMLGAITGAGKEGELPSATYTPMELTGGTAENIQYIFAGRQRIALTSVEPETDLKAVEAILPKGNYVCIPSLEQVPEAVCNLREADGILLLVKAGACNAKRIQHLLHNLKIQDCKVEGALLYQGNQTLWKAYRFPAAWGKEK